MLVTFAGLLPVLQLLADCLSAVNLGAVARPAGPRAAAAPARCAFDQQLALARTVFAYVENHNFYIDNWCFTLFWNKGREFGALLARHGFLDQGEDIFMLRMSPETRAHTKAIMSLTFAQLAAGAGGHP
jgi:hypothetical protein